MALSPSDLKPVRQRRYLAKDFDSLRATLLEYARRYYKDRIQDFSEASVGGMFLDLAALVGDNLSFYLDHQYGELSYETAVETSNIEKLLRTAGVPITGASPALVPVTCYVEIPAKNLNGAIIPDPDAIPTVLSNTVFAADNGVEFILIEDINFAAQKSDGTYAADVKIGNQSADNTIQTFIMAATGLCISGKEATETVTIGTEFVPFRKISLSNPNVTDILSVTDGFGNVYYKVNDLTHDVVYKNVLNTARDNDLVRDAMKVVPVPYRYVVNVDIESRTSTLTFGGGTADTLNDDVIPDPTDFALSLPYQQTFSRVAVNPEKLLTTNTLGVAATSTTLTIVYRYGGGLEHNVNEDAVRTAKTLRMFFPGNPQAAVAARIKGSLECSNRTRASGGEDPLTQDELKALIPSIKNSQERIVTREDLLARVYTIPSNFGRVFRAATRSNKQNPLSTQLFIVSRSPDLKLITSPDTLKQNLVKYLNPYRCISDAIDVLDAAIINLTLVFEIVVDPVLNKSIVLQNILTKLQTQFDIKNFHIDQPLVISEVVNTVFSVQGIISVNRVEFTNIVGTVSNRTYSDVTFDVATNTKQGIIFPPPGGIFSIKYPEVDITGRVVI